MRDVLGWIVLGSLALTLTGFAWYSRMSTRLHARIRARRTATLAEDIAQQNRGR